MLVVDGIVIVELQLTEFSTGDVAQSGLDQVVSLLYVEHRLPIPDVGVEQTTDRPCFGHLGEVTLQLGELYLWHHLRQLTAHGLDVLEVEIDYLRLNLSGDMGHLQSVEEPPEIVLQHLLVVASLRLRGLDSCTHNH